MTQDRSVFEYWSHAASYLPMKDYRFSLLRKKRFAEGKSHWFKHNKKVMRFVLDRITSEGKLPAGIDQNLPSPKEAALHRIHCALNAHGIATEQEIRYLRSDLKREQSHVLKELLESGNLTRVLIEGDQSTPYFVHTEKLKQLTLPGVLRIHILSPFDNLVIQRRRLLLFAHPLWQHLCREA